MGYQGKAHQEIHHAALIQHWDIWRCGWKSQAHKFKEHTGEHTSSKSFFCLKHSEIPAVRKHALKCKIISWEAHIRFWWLLHYAIVFLLLPVVKPYLHWKLTTHFLPAIPRKYFSVRSHTSCSSNRKKRVINIYNSYYTYFTLDESDI